MNSRLNANGIEIIDVKAEEVILVPVVGATLNAFERGIGGNARLGVPIVRLGLLTANGPTTLDTKDKKVVRVTATWDGDPGDKIGNGGELIGSVDPRENGSQATMAKLIRTKASEKGLPMDKVVLVVYEK